jgi:hypothetical protein
MTRADESGWSFFAGNLTDLDRTAEFSVQRRVDQRKLLHGTQRCLTKAEGTATCSTGMENTKLLQLPVTSRANSGVAKTPAS